MRNNKLKWSWLVVLLVLGLVMVTVGCSDDDDDDDDSAPATTDPLALARAGWSAFSAMDWDEAIDNFEAAIAAGATSTDAYSGAGWTYYLVTDDAYANSNVTAKARWEAGFDKTGSLNDINVGLGFLAFDEGDFDTTIEHIRDIAINIPTYSFIHMPSVDINDLYVTLAKCYFFKAEYEVDGADNDALEFIWKLNEHFLPERDGTGNITDNGVDEIAQEIERLDAIVRGF
jgi:tetratricopeptide (TPR) repeat protein